MVGERGSTNVVALQMHAQALRCSSKVIQHCLRTLPFWQAWYAAHPNQVEPYSRVTPLLHAVNPYSSTMKQCFATCPEVELGQISGLVALLLTKQD